MTHRVIKFEKLPMPEEDEMWARLAKELKESIYQPVGLPPEILFAREGYVAVQRALAANVPKEKAPMDTERKGCCHADSDGDCTWEGCPQLRDGEPERSGRSCPLPPGPHSLNGVREMMQNAELEDEE